MTVRQGWARWIRGDAAFLIGLSLFVVLVRLVAFDWVEYFGLTYVPNHDMYQGASFFTTSMHSVRLYGDIAWWNPLTDAGYAQYYQGFFSPLAPTFGHITFIVWAQIIWVLALFGIAIPEYVQYLIVSYLILPFLATLAFAWFAAAFLRSRMAVAIAALVFGLSGIAIWNGAWMYFQEPATFFFLLGALLRLIQRPSPATVAVVGIAGLVQICSINYWTFYNVGMGILVIGSYLLTTPDDLRARGRELLAAWPWRSRVGGLAVAAVLLTLVGWLVIIGLAYRDQQPAFIRTSGQIGIEDAFSRLHDVRTYTTQLFDPFIERVIAAYKQENGAHNARYLGATLIPLLLLLCAAKLQPRTYWLILMALGTFIICMAPPYLLVTWATIAPIRAVRHLFYFYSQYWQITIVLLAALGLDIARRWPEDAPQRTTAIRYLARACWLAVGVLIAALALSSSYPAGDLGMQAVTYLATLILLACVLLLFWLQTPDRRIGRILLAAFLVLTISDLSRWYWRASLADANFTASRQDFSHLPKPLPEQTRHALATPWPTPDVSKGFEAGLTAAMPFTNNFWPSNIFLPSLARVHLGDFPPAFGHTQLSGPPFAFFTRALTEADYRSLPDLEKGTANPARMLVLGPPDAVSASRRGVDGLVPDVPFTWTGYSYNSIAFTVEAPSAGWVSVKQLADPQWRLRVDGNATTFVSANIVGLAILVEPGHHAIALDYRPLSRLLYWPSAFLLEASIALLLIVASRE